MSQEEISLLKEEGYSYAVLMKAKKLCSYQERMNKYAYAARIFALVLGTILLPLLFRKDFVFSFSSLNIFIASVYIIIAALTYYLFTVWSKYKGNFNNLRLDLIDHIGKNLCSCKEVCDHRDRFIIFMERKNIDLIFK